MNNRLSSGLAAMLLVSSTTLGVTASPMFGLAQASNDSSASSANQTPERQLSETPTLSEVNASYAYSASPPHTVKLGEQQQQESSIGHPAPESAVAKIHAHSLNGKPAATLYVRNIPVLTFTGSPNLQSGSTMAADQADVKIGSSQAPDSTSDSTTADLPSRLTQRYTTQFVANLDNPKPTGTLPDNPSATLRQSVSEPQVSEVPLSDSPVAETVALTSQVSSISHNTPVSNPTASQAADPVGRASAIAAQLNQFYRDGLDPEKITVRWQEPEKASGQTSSSSGQYVVKLDQATIVAVNATTLLPDSTQNLEQDALQVANRLRRLLGNAAPIQTVEGKPQVTSPWTQAAIAVPGAVVSTVQGWASWYGPGFHGNLTASGEVYNQEALTAAHPSLPMGTRVLVTNLDTGRSITVRINDRGPYYGGRIIDLSAGAARAIGVIHSGVAPVRVDILGR
ncbi:MAG: septal ring lytic transglycosylase RlpA family protein [Synechococcales bacterium]|nr:septal ring lytic transglycosylase RlpA family protein [Synechococcales bacterium]